MSLEVPVVFPYEFRRHYKEAQLYWQDLRSLEIHNEQQNKEVLGM